MQQKQKLISFINQVFLDVKPKDETVAIASTSNLSKESNQPAYVSPMPVLEDALFVLTTLSKSIPQEKQKQIFRQALRQYGDGHLDQVLLEATLRKAQMTQAMQNCSHEIDSEIANVNAELDRLWNLRDQITEKAKQHQWALSQECATLDNVISLMVSSSTDKSAPLLRDTSNRPEPVLPRNPRQLSAIAGAR